MLPLQRKKRSFDFGSDTHTCEIVVFEIRNRPLVSIHRYCCRGGKGVELSSKGHVSTDRNLDARTAVDNSYAQHECPSLR